MLRIAGLLLFALLFAAPLAIAQSATPVGVWQDDSGRIQVQIAPCGEFLCGTLLWFRWPNDDQGLPVVDLKNRDPGLRGRPLLGLVILYGLRRTGERTWEDGKIYNPEDGANYHANMSINDDGSLRVRAYGLLPIFGRTRVWRRIR
ncbi:DUF2147 domain-containing protein [Ferrovibrio xuzhouensis]|uniref:DUF2147 domain-containing protein n=1 Tax=Ferrovibrio xuzhouensis TaxID=1576914 RepID=A0ABV7VIA5_9PROT